MLKWRNVLNRSQRTIRSLTGLERQEFDALTSSFNEAYTQHKPLWSKVRNRKRQSGAGKRPSLRTAEDKQLFILVYFKAYPTQDLLSLLFGCTQSWACTWIHRLTLVLETALGKKLQLPKRVKRISTIEEFVEKFPELSFIIDGTERPRTRPKNKETQKSHYSGKKKRHTMKNTIVSDNKSKKVIMLGSTFAGSVHDKKMVDIEPIIFPPGSDVYQDTGYQGYAPSGVRVLQPRKKKRGQHRSDEDRTYNREISHTRVRVEHSICGVKRSRIVSDIYRNRKSGYEDQVMMVACGLHNFRTDMRM